MPPPETPGHSQASLAQSLLRTLLLASGSWCTQGFVCAFQALFLQSCGSPIINTSGLQSQSWGFSVPLPDPQVGKSVVGPRTFLTVREFLWYNCSAVCGLSAQWLYGGVNGDLQEGLWHRLCDQVASPRAPVPATGHC